MNRKRREEGGKVKVTVAYLMHNHPTGDLLCTVSVKTVLFCVIYQKPYQLSPMCSAPMFLSQVKSMLISWSFRFKNP